MRIGSLFSQRTQRINLGGASRRKVGRAHGDEDQRQRCADKGKHVELSEAEKDAVSEGPAGWYAQKQTRSDPNNSQAESLLQDHAQHARGSRSKCDANANLAGAAAHGVSYKPV